MGLGTQKLLQEQFWIFQSKTAACFSLFLYLQRNGILWAYFLVKQDYAWEMEKFVLGETDLQESRYYLSSQARASIPSWFTCIVCGCDFLTRLTLIVPTKFVWTSGGSLSYRWGWNVSVVCRRIHSSHNCIKQFEKLFKLLALGIKIVFCSWRLGSVPRRGAGAVHRGCASFVCFRTATPLPEVRGADHCLRQVLELVGPQVFNSVWQRLRSWHQSLHATRLDKYMGNVLFS